MEYGYDYIKKCNIIKNEESSNGVITYYECNSLEVSDSCILQNISPRIIHRFSGSTSAVVTNCMLDEGAASNVESYVSITNTPLNTFTINIPHLSTGVCFAQFETPVENTASASATASSINTPIKCIPNTKVCIKRPSGGYYFR